MTRARTGSGRPTARTTTGWSRSSAPTTRTTCSASTRTSRRRGHLGARGHLEDRARHALRVVGLRAVPEPFEAHELGAGDEAKQPRRVALEGDDPVARAPGDAHGH